MSMLSALDAAIPTGAQGSAQANWTETWRPTSAGPGGMGAGTTQLPAPLLWTVATNNAGDVRSIQTSVPKTMTGEVGGGPLIPTRPAARGGARVQVRAKPEFPG